MGKEKRGQEFNRPFRRLETSIPRNVYSRQSLLNLSISSQSELRRANHCTREEDFDYRPAGRVIGRGDR